MRAKLLEEKGKKSRHDFWLRDLRMFKQARERRGGKTRCILTTYRDHSTECHQDGSHLSSIRDGKNGQCRISGMACLLLRQFVREQVGFVSQRVRAVEVPGIGGGFCLRFIGANLIHHAFLRRSELPSSNAFHVRISRGQQLVRTLTLVLLLLPAASGSKFRCALPCSTVLNHHFA